MLRKSTRSIKRFRRYYLVILLISLINTYAFSQNTISGTVTSDEGETLPGVSVVVKGTTTGTITDASGKYQLKYAGDGNAIISFSFIGYVQEEVKVNNRTTIDVVLTADIATLSEVVVVGYGTVQKKDLTSSVSSISSKQLKDIPINSAAEALSGRLAGVQIISSEGSPNAEVQIRVRGGGSITQDNSPLYVVDGIQVENALSVLSPQDIESIDVLKDASATAIYGARGANGVVIITTKGGREMKTTVSYNGLVGVRQLANKLDVMNSYDFVRYQYERSRGSSAEELEFLNTYGHYDDLENYKNIPTTDWQEEVFGRDALMQTHNFAIAGGTAATSFNLSLTSNTEEGVMLASDFDRKLVNFKFDHKITKKLRAGFNVRYNNTVVNGAGTATAGSSSVNRLRHSVKYRPIIFPGQTVDSYDPDYAAETSANSLSLVNPILLSAAEYKKNKSEVLNLNGYVSYDITKFMTFRSTLGFDFTRRGENIFNDTITNASKLNGSSKPLASIETFNRSILNNSNVLTISSSNIESVFTEHNKVDFLLGHEIYETTERGNYLETRLFPVGITPERALGNMGLGTPQIPRSSEVSTRLLSFFSRLNYSYRDKYLVSLTMRADGSSKFAKGKKWGYFPSASLAWRLSNEGFMEALKTTVSDLKVRASFGIAGNNRIGDFMYLTQFGPNQYYELNNNQIVGYGPLDLANANLQWESTLSRNIGLDAGFFNNRLQISVDGYYNSTDELLVRVPVPTSSGYPDQTQNVGKTSNRGVELQLSGTPVATKDFTWNASFNVSFNKNKVESLGLQKSFLFGSGWGGSAAPFDYVVKVGEPVGSIWGLETDGYYDIDDFTYTDGKYTLKDGIASNQGITSLVPQPGLLKFNDINGDTIINDLDRKIIGDATPKFFGGFNQQFAYRNFDLSVFVNFQYGNDVLNANKLEFSSGYTEDSNLLTIMNDRWRNVNAEGQVVTDPEELRALNANAKIWTPLTSASSFYPHSWAVEDASFIRINNITLGYSLPTTLLSKIKVSRLRFYGTVNNLAVFTKYTGYDPEVSTRRNAPVTPGVDYAAYPRSRAYIFGVNLTF